MKKTLRMLESSYHFLIFTGILISLGLVEGGKVKMSIRVASSVCGVMENYQETKEIPEPLKSFPQGVRFIDGDEYFEWQKCEPGGQILFNAFIY